MVYFAGGGKLIESLPLAGRLDQLEIAGWELEGFGPWPTSTGSCQQVRAESQDGELGPAFVQEAKAGHQTLTSIEFQRAHFIQDEQVGFLDLFQAAITPRQGLGGETPAGRRRLALYRRYLGIISIRQPALLGAFQVEQVDSNLFSVVEDRRGN